MKLPRIILIINCSDPSGQAASDLQLLLYCPLCLIALIVASIAPS